MIELAEIKQDQIVFDLGCGDGRVVFAAAEKGAQVIGIELNIFIYALACFRKRISHKKGTIIRGNFLKVDLRNADTIFCFLVGKGMKKLSEKFRRELKKGCRVISHGAELPGWKAEKMITLKRFIKKYVIYFYSV